jgi:N-sulfoglucosamine sulfohydrolase
MRNNYLKSFILITPLILVRCQTTSQEGKIQKRPNILIAMGDDISFPHMGAYGTQWVKTPGFDMVANKGILFKNAYTPNAKSSPSRACFLTARNSWQLEEASNHIPFFPPKFKTFMESLDEHGYYVGHTAKGWAPGVALDSAGNPRQLTGKAFNSKKLVPPAKGISTVDYAGNFEDFLNTRDDNKPFCFWYGSNEPHRDYEYGSGVAIGGKSVSDISNVFGFWPDNDTVRNDMLDYAFEIEHFDNHLVKMLEILKKRGELENTIVIVTADNGMPFPRVKGQAYEFSNHMPLAIMWGKGIKNPGRIIYDFISFIDFAPTLLEVSGVKQSESGMQPIEGVSFTDIFYTRKNRYVSEKRNYVLIGKERHDIGRPDDVGYPIRGIIKDGFLFLKNFKPDRWPACNPETGYLNCDGSPTKTLILNMRRSGRSIEFWNLSFGMRNQEEMYNISKDPECMSNLALNAGYNNIKQKLHEQLYNELLKQNDPRVLGNGDIFDKYPYAQKATKDFYNRYMKGQISRKNAGWVDSTDFETIEIHDSKLTGKQRLSDQ